MNKLGVPRYCINQELIVNVSFKETIKMTETFISTFYEKGKPDIVIREAKILENKRYFTLHYMGKVN